MVVSMCQSCDKLALRDNGRNGLLLLILMVNVYPKVSNPNKEGI